MTSNNKKKCASTFSNLIVLTIHQLNPHISLQLPKAKEQPSP